MGREKTNEGTSVGQGAAVERGFSIASSELVLLDVPQIHVVDMEVETGHSRSARRSWEVAILALAWKSLSV